MANCLFSRKNKCFSLPILHFSTVYVSQLNLLKQHSSLSTVSLAHLPPFCRQGAKTLHKFSLGALPSKMALSLSAPRIAPAALTENWTFVPFLFILQRCHCVRCSLGALRWCERHPGVGKLSSQKRKKKRKGEPQSTNQDQVNSTFAEVKEKLDFGGRENFYYYFIIYLFLYFLKKSSDCGDFILKEDCVSARICLKSHR